MAQQQWASQYVQWSFSSPPSEVWNIDQQVWIPAPNTASYWPLQWGFTGQNYGGYIGLQAVTATQHQVRFSVWNATAARGPNKNEPFGGEGIGFTCTMPLTIDTTKFYRLRLWRLAAEGDGQWWGGWLIATDDTGALVEHLIGEIKAPTAGTSVAASSISNFVEYWGDAVPKCADVPLSIAGFTPPAVNYAGKGTGRYASYSTYKASTKAEGNTCTDGEQGNGALITASPYDYGFAEGILMYLGGQSSSHRLPPETTTPPDMPNS